MKTIAGEFTGFLVVGAVNTALTYVLFLVLARYTHYWTAYTIASLLGIALSYVLNALFVFKARHSTGAMFKFIVRLCVSISFWLVVARRDGRWVGFRQAGRHADRRRDQCTHDVCSR